MAKFMNSARRSKSPVRTNTIRGKISGPIPISTIEDDEFPIRSPGTGIATPVGHEGVEKQLQMPKPSEEKPAQQPVQQRPLTPSSTYEDIDPVRKTPDTQAASQLSHESPPPRTEGSSVNPESKMASVRQQSPEKSQRKKGSLRSILGRIFGGKKRKNTTSSPLGRRENGHIDQYRSNPSQIRNSKTISPKSRSASLPINEFNRALRSHSLVLNDARAFANGDSERPGLDTVNSRRRSATTPSRTGHLQKFVSDSDWMGLSPRPVSGRGRAGSFSDREAHAPIGSAVTSGSHPNRRSRSLNHLRRAGNDNEGHRRRSDEIRYWRESYDPDALSPMSSNKENEPPLPSNGNLTMNEAIVEEKPQPFNFGPMGALAGMKITQAASLEDRLETMEIRLQKMERFMCQIYDIRSNVVMQDAPKPGVMRGYSPVGRPQTDTSDFSLPMRQQNGMYQQTNNPQAGRITPQRSYTHDVSRPSTTSTQGQSPHKPYNELSPPPSFVTTSSHVPSRADTEPLNSSQPSASSLSQFQRPERSRPLSTSTTIRGHASSPTPNPTDLQQSARQDHGTIPYSKHGSLTAHHYTALMNIIREETNAREHLEMIVLKLQNQLHNALSSTPAGPRSIGEIDDDSRYPMPGSEQEPQQGVVKIERMTVGSKHSDHMEGVEPFEFDKSNYGNDSIARGFENEDDEVWRTPLEEHPKFIYEDDRRSDRPVERTMSLSQMTLGRAAQRINL